MAADKIREASLLITGCANSSAYRKDSENHFLALQAQMTAEIAAQLAELNEHLRAQRSDSGKDKQ